MPKTNNLRVLEVVPVLSPRELHGELPASARAAEFVVRARREIEGVIAGRDRRMLVIVGPCSIHDPQAAREYAGRLKIVARSLADELLICMRTYFEKPRTAMGWKGLINDPHLNGSHDLGAGLRSARRLLLDLCELGLPCATETLDPVVPQYIADLIAWSAIGARTTESQTHREMASGLSMPVGFKNATDGNLMAAANAMRAAREPHSFLGIDVDGRVAVIRTAGNPYCHAVLRGGTQGTNYHASAVEAASQQLRAHGVESRVLVDCSHANSGKNHENQLAVLAEIGEQLQAGSSALLGVMVESHLVEGRQELSPQLRYGQSITDACIDFPRTEQALIKLARAVRSGRGD